MPKLRAVSAGGSTAAGNGKDEEVEHAVVDDAWWLMRSMCLGTEKQQRATRRTPEVVEAPPLERRAGVHPKLM